MKKTIKFFFLTVVVSTFIISCNDDDDNTSELLETSETLITSETSTVSESSEETENSEEPFKFEAGDYNIAWGGGNPNFKTQLTKTDENTLEGGFCVNNTLENCNDIGPIVITRNGNCATFKFSDIGCGPTATEPGEFEGIGNITADNTYEFTVNGEDCIRKYVDVKVVITKIVN